MIPFLDLKAQYQSIKPEIDSAISQVVESTQFVLGPEVTAFEQEFAAFCGTSHGIGVNSGTSALHLALLAVGVRPGDEVITVPFTFVATVAAILYCGARPVFVDIDPVSLTMDPAQVERAITPHTRAIMPVHLYGQVADMTPLLDIARRHHLTVIEDAAQAHGADYQGHRAGGIGDIGCFSFYPGKNLGAYGEAGMVVTSNPDLARTIRMLRDWGMERKHEHVMHGFNYRMDAIQGAVLRVKLRHVDQWNAARRERALWYNTLLADAGVTVPEMLPDRTPIYHIYAIRTSRRAALQAALAEQQIQTAIHYPYVIYQLPAYASLGHHAGDFPHAEHAAARVLSLPIYPELTRAAVEEVAGVVRELV